MNAEELRAVRKRLGLTQQRLAAELGMSHRRITQYEAGAVIPRVVELALEALAGQIAEHRG